MANICASFPVHSVEVGPQLPRIDAAGLESGWNSYGKLVAASPIDPSVPLVDHTKLGPNLLVGMVYSAFYQHYPLKLNANVIWLTILQQFGSYVARHGEELRHLFVQHEGKKALTVIRPDFSYDNPNNDWGSAMTGFADLIDKNTSPGTRDALRLDFSNSTPVDVVCGDVAMMDIAKTYFEYRLYGGCGIPRIDLLGTAEDWQRLLEKIRYLKRFAIEKDPDNFGAWVQGLEVIGGKFLEAVGGSPDRAFFGTVLNEAEGSGQIGQPITGWICFLFLYNKNSRPIYSKAAWDAYARAKSLGGADAALKWAKESQGLNGCERAADFGLSLEDFPHGMAKAPINMTWADVRIDELLLAIAGTATVHQHADGALEARTGWAILRKPEGEARRGVRGGLMAPRTAADFWGDVE